MNIVIFITLKGVIFVDIHCIYGNELLQNSLPLHFTDVHYFWTKIIAMLYCAFRKAMIRNACRASFSCICIPVQSAMYNRLRYIFAKILPFRYSNISKSTIVHIVLQTIVKNSQHLQSRYGLFVTPFKNFATENTKKTF